MYASTAASECVHTNFSARPRPFSLRCTAATSGSVSASRSATSAVASVLALSAMVIRNRYGNSARRYACSRRTHGSRSICSL
jgi:hypothetical protein